MSQENVELWRGVVEDFLVGESESSWEAWLVRARAILDPEIEWDATEAPMPDIADVYHGADGVLRWWREWLAAWETLRFEYELVDAGDRVVMLLSQRMRGRSTGIEVRWGTTHTLPPSGTGWWSTGSSTAASPKLSKPWGWRSSPLARRGSASSPTVHAMNFKRMADKAKRLIDDRGGTDQLKQDAERLRGIATGPGTAKEKAKAAGEALKQPSPATSDSRPEADQRGSQARPGSTPTE